jgi:hypothetical protein
MSINFSASFAVLNSFKNDMPNPFHQDSFPETSECINGSYVNGDMIVFWEKVADIQLGGKHELRSIIGEDCCGSKKMTPEEFVNYIVAANPGYRVFSWTAAKEMAVDICEGYVSVSWG